MAKNQTGQRHGCRQNRVITPKTSARTTASVSSKNVDELTRMVNEAASTWEKRERYKEEPPTFRWDAYREAVATGTDGFVCRSSRASKERGIAMIPLTEVFPSLSWQQWEHQSRMVYLRRSRKYQEEIYGPAAASDETAPAEIEEPEASREIFKLAIEELLLSANSEFVLCVPGRETTQVILGGPGSGKSTILHYVMLRVCQAGVVSDTLLIHLRDAPIPFLIELRNDVLQKVPGFRQLYCAESPRNTTT